MSTPKAVTGRVTAVKRLGLTHSGNPILAIQFDATGETWHRVSDDASLAYGIEAPEYADTPHTFELTRAGRLSGREHPVEIHPIADPS